jgi:hypothetical protein
LIFVASGYLTFGQKQLVLLKGERVLLRLYPGDDFVFRVAGSREVRHTYINNLSDTSVVTNRDTIPYHKIDRVYSRRNTFANEVGFVLTVGGAGYFVIDQINNVVIHGNQARLDNAVALTSVSLVAIGLPMMLSGRNYQRLYGNKRLLMVTEKSPFYQNDKPKGYVSPYIPR